MATNYSNIPTYPLEVAIVTISEDITLLDEKLITKALKTLNEYGIKGTLYNRSSETHLTDLQKRVHLLHKAFEDPSITGIIIGLGGTQAIDLLPYIDYNLIKNNAKPICGFSDATTVLNAIHVKTGITTYYGPMLFSFAANADIDYTMIFFKKALFSKQPFKLQPSLIWKNFDEDILRASDQFIVIRGGKASGTLIGGHIPSLNLLQGTPYFPQLDGAILFIEICNRYGKDAVKKLKQYLNSLLLQNSADGIRGLLIGRLYGHKDIMENEINDFLLLHPKLQNIPIITNITFGHTTPLLTLPIGRTAYIDNDQITIDRK